MTPRRLAFPDLAGPLLAAGALLALVPAAVPLAVVLATSLVALHPLRRVIALAAVGALVLGWAVGTWRLGELDADPLAPLVGHVLVDAEVEVGEAWRGGGYGRIALGRVLGPGGGPVLLRISGATGPARGSVLRVSGPLERPRGPRDGFDERAWLAHQGIHAVLRLQQTVVIGRRGGPIGAADRIRAAAVDVLGAAGEGDRRGVVIGLVLGGGAGLTDAAVDDFRAAGLAHLLAVSGGNIALLLALVVLVTWALGGTRRHAMGAGVGAIIGYTAVVGPSPSVLRAAIAGVVGCAVWLLGRPRDAWRALGLGLGLLLAWNPYGAWDPGLQLSFVAVAAILLVVPRVRGWADASGVPQAVVGAAAVTAAATVATAPIAWWHFGRATILAAIPANLLAAPAVPLALWTAVVGIAVAPAAPAAGVGIAWLAQWPGLWILLCARWGARLAAATPTWLLPVLCAALAAGLAARRRR